MKHNNKQRGAVSLFVVIFAALLITVVTVSFIRIMIQNQQRANAVDLSQSAYDSAQVGVEDAKRALMRYQSICSSGGDCVAAKAKINSSECNEAIKTLSDIENLSGTDVEIPVQNGTNPNKLDQAYTCVKLNMSPDDYLGELTQDSSKMIPLVGESPFDTIKVQWFTSKDFSKDLEGAESKADIPEFASGVPLLIQNSWTSAAQPNRPSILRAQLIQFNSSGFSVDERPGLGTPPTNNTLFLYPSTKIDTPKSFSSNIRKTFDPLDTPTQVNCNDLSIGGVYACSANMEMPHNSNAHVQYLNLKSFYKKTTNYRITLFKTNGDTVKFDGVQPSIDSTGRANDMFRRVQARVELGVDFTYPKAAVDINGNFCKDFIVTDRPDDYSSNSDCRP